MLNADFCLLFWQINGYGRAFAAFYVDAAAVFGYDAVDDREAETCAAAAAVKRLEYLIYIFHSDAVSGVSDNYPDQCGKRLGKRDR